MAVVLNAFGTFSLPTEDPLLFSSPISKKEKQTGIVFWLNLKCVLFTRKSFSFSECMNDIEIKRSMEVEYTMRV